MRRSACSPCTTTPRPRRARRTKPRRRVEARLRRERDANFVAVGGYDGMAAIMYAIREQKGKLDPDRTMELLKNFKDPNSPRGPISIDPATRDIRADEYLREVRRAVAASSPNVEIRPGGHRGEGSLEGAAKRNIAIRKRDAFFGAFALSF